MHTNLGESLNFVHLATAVLYETVMATGVYTGTFTGTGTGVSWLQVQALNR